jgi:hypothetical protein
MQALGEVSAWIGPRFVVVYFCRSSGSNHLGTDHRLDQATAGGQRYRRTFRSIPCSWRVGGLSKRASTLLIIRTIPIIALRQSLPIVVT